MRKDLPVIDDMFDMTKISKSKRLAVDTWSLAPAPSLPLFEEFEEVKAYTVASCGGIPVDVLKYMEETVAKLKKIRFRARLDGNPHDTLQQIAYDGSENMKAIYKTNPKYGDPDHANYMGTFKKPIYDAHAITAAAYNMEAVQFNRKQGFNMKEKREKIMQSSMTDQEKIMAITELMKEKESAGTGPRKFNMLEPGRRSRMAVKAHLLFGDECTNPVKFVIICSPDGAKTPEEVNANEDSDKNNTSVFINQIIYMAYYFDIRVFNIMKEEDRKALDEEIASYSK